MPRGSFTRRSFKTQSFELFTLSRYDFYLPFLRVCSTSNVIFDSITTLQIYTESALKIFFYLGKLPLDDYKKLSVQMQLKLSAKFNCKHCQHLGVGDVHFS